MKLTPVEEAIDKLKDIDISEPAETICIGGESYVNTRRIKVLIEALEKDIKRITSEPVMDMIGCVEERNGEIEGRKYAISIIKEILL